MPWDKSDSDLEKQYAKLDAKIQEDRKIRSKMNELIQQIEKVRMVATGTISKKGQRTYTYENPVDTIGEPLTDKVRMELKTTLISKIDTFLK